MKIGGLVLSILGLLLSILSFFLSPFCAIAALPASIVGLVLSVVAGKREKSSMSTAGLVLGIIATVFSTITFFTCGICALTAAAVL